MENQRYLPIKEAKTFFAEKNLNETVNEINGFIEKTSHDVGKGKARKINKGFIVTKLEGYNLLDEFIEKYWVNGKTGDGKKISNGYKNQYFEYMRNSPEIDDGNDDNSSFAYEKDLQNFLVKNLSIIEPDLKLYVDEEDGKNGLEYPAEGRFIDILALDKNNNFVVIELKVSKGYDRVVGQLLRYKNWIRRNLAEKGQNVRGMIICKEITNDLFLACDGLSDIELFEYELSIKLKKKDII